jgi:hypothetical protein
METFIHELSGSKLDRVIGGAITDQEWATGHIPAGKTGSSGSSSGGDGTSIGIWTAPKLAFFF